MMGRERFNPYQILGENEGDLGGCAMNLLGRTLYGGLGAILGSSLAPVVVLMYRSTEPGFLETVRSGSAEPMLTSVALVGGFIGLIIGAVKVH